MKRTPVNPWSWSVGLGFNQAELIDGHRRELVCSGQTAVDADGRPQHPGDMAAQLDLALSNLETVLAGADMTFANVVRLNVYTTDLDALLEHFAKLSDRLVDRRPGRPAAGVEQGPGAGGRTSQPRPCPDPVDGLALGGELVAPPVAQVLDPVAVQKDRLVEIDTTPSRQVRGSSYGGAVHVGVREGFQEACLALS